MENNEYVHLTYLCEADSSTDIKVKRLKDFGMASVSRFMKQGIFPVSLLYEKRGRVVRQMENSLDGFECVHGNLYRPTGDGYVIAYRLKQAA